MNNRRNNRSRVFIYPSLPALKNRIGFLRLTIFFLSLFTSSAVAAQDEHSLEEMSVSVNVPRIGTAELTALISQNEAYIQPKSLFDFLKIHAEVSPRLDSVYGQFINAGAFYLFDQPSKKVVFRNEVFQLLAEDMIHTSTGLYVRTGIFNQVFGLDCRFSFRQLSITVSTQAELPAMRDLRLEMMRKNISRIKGEQKADTMVGRGFTWFSLANADWHLTASQLGSSQDARASLRLGGMLAGGEARLDLNYIQGQRFDPNRQYFQWRYANNEFSPLRQVQVGRIQPQFSSSVFDPVLGIQISNTPTSRRKSFGTYRISDQTEPGSTVELYVNNTLVDYVQSDENGFYSFDIPLLYGNSAIKLKFYGPMGEESIQEQALSVPFNFLPGRQFEYVVAAGRVKDAENSSFTRGQFSYGISQKITVGGGAEYITSRSAGKPMPFVNVSLRVAPGLLIKAEHMQAAATRIHFNYRVFSQVQGDFVYTRYQPGQTAFMYNYLSEKKLTISAPVRLNNFRALTRINLSNIQMPKTRFTTADLVFAGAARSFSTHLGTSATFRKNASPVIRSSFAFGWHLPGRSKLVPQAEFDFTSRNFILLKAEYQKSIGRTSYLHLGYEKSFTTGLSYVNLGLRLNFSFSQASFTARHDGSTANTSFTASGSILYDANTGFMKLRNRTSTGRGALLLLPFLDINCNGKKEPEEPRLKGIRFKINGGSMLTGRDSFSRVADLEPYVNYFLEPDPGSLSNIAWRLQSKSFSVLVEPNHTTRVEVPVAVMAEASGTVYFNSGKGKTPMAGISIFFYNSERQLVAKTLTESDGYFSYLGLVPGTYQIMIDPDQLALLKYQSKTGQIRLSIMPDKDGAVMNDLNFEITGSDASEIR